jgi:hypothetical protein
MSDMFPEFLLLPHPVLCYSAPRRTLLSAFLRLEVFMFVVLGLCFVV